MAAPIHVFASAELDEHVTPPWHPERQGRLDAALAGIPAAGLDGASNSVSRPSPSGANHACAHARLRRPARAVLCGRRWRPRRRHLGGARFVDHRAPGGRRRARRRRGARRATSVTSRSLPAGRPDIMPWPTGRWDSACSTVSRWPRRTGGDVANGWPSSTGTCITATAPRTSSTTTSACCTSRPTSRRSTRARAGPPRRADRTHRSRTATCRSRPAPAVTCIARPSTNRSPRSSRRTPRLAVHLRRLRRPPQRSARRPRTHLGRLRRPRGAPAGARAEPANGRRVGRRLRLRRPVDVDRSHAGGDGRRAPSP